MTLHVLSWVANGIVGVEADSPEEARDILKEDIEERCEFPSETGAILVWVVPDNRETPSDTQIRSTE